MSRRIKVALLVLVVALAGVAAWQILGLGRGEPVYQGKRLSVWLQGYEIFQDAPETDEAVRRMGTNAIPCLLRLLRTQEHPWLYRVADWISFHRTIHRWIGNPDFLIRSYAESRRERAFMAFHALGPAAGSAAPELIRMYRQGISESSAFGPAAVLGEIGRAAEPAIPFLMQGLASPNQGSRERAVATLGEIHLQPEVVVPALIKALHDPASAVRFAAVKALPRYGERAKAAVPALLEKLKDPSAYGEAGPALDEVHADPEIAVPALVNALNEPAVNCRCGAALGLGAFGPTAKVAVPALVRSLNDTNAEVRECATNALKKIDRGAAAQAGLR